MDGLFNMVNEIKNTMAASAKISPRKLSIETYTSVGKYYWSIWYGEIELANGVFKNYLS